MEFTTDAAGVQHPVIDRKDYYTESEIKSMGGLGIFAWITERPDDVPISVWNQFCHCAGSGKELRGWGYDEVHNWWYHIGCGKPRPHYGILFECDSCDEWFRTERIPERMFVCGPCKAANE